MLTAHELKHTLTQLAHNDYRPAASAAVWPLAQAMMTHLGSPDPELRDDLIYETLAVWAQRVFDDDQLRALLALALDDEHLFYGLGERGSDTVFMRTFSLLVIALVVEQHRAHALFPPAEIRSISAGVRRYLAQEQDWRGHCDKGWAHAAAHAADVLGELAGCAELQGEDLAELLQAVRDCLWNAPAVFTDQEDERLGRAVLALLSRELLSAAQVTDWLHAFTLCGKPAAYAGRVRRWNIKNFLRSLYFQSLYRQQSVEFQPALLAALREVSDFK